MVVHQELHESLGHATFHLLEKRVFTDEVLLNQCGALEDLAVDHVLSIAKTFPTTHIEVDSKSSSALHWRHASIDVLTPVDVELLDPQMTQRVVACVSHAVLLSRLHQLLVDVLHNLNLFALTQRRRRLHSRTSLGQ